MKRAAFRTLLILAVALTVFSPIPATAGANGGVVLWQIGKPDGPVNPIAGSAEYPANNAFSAQVDYTIGVDPDPIDSPSSPGYIGPDNVCAFAGGRPCTDTTAKLVIHFTLGCDYGEGDLTLIYDRYGSESDKLLLDEVLFATISATEGGFRQFQFDLGAVSAGDHTLTIDYAGGGSGNGHYVDYLKLVSTFPCVSIDLDPDDSTNPVGTEHTVEATISPAIEGVPIAFTVSGANSASGIVDTNALGVASFTYTGSAPGTDTIVASVEGTTIEADPVRKVWLEPFVTGGGNIKDGKKVIWTFGGNVGLLGDSSVTIAGQFQIVDHVNKVAYHLNDFDSLVFSCTDCPAESPEATHDTATFVGSGTDNAGNSVTFTVIIQDLGEPGKGVDKIELTGPPTFALQVIDGGNFQVHDIE